MNAGRIQRRIVLVVISVALLMYLSVRLYAQFRHVDVYVARDAPMPAELASGLHMDENKIDPTVRIESPYERAPDKVLSLNEIRRVRLTLAWSGGMPAFIDSVTIFNQTNVVARWNGKTFIREYQLVKDGGSWRVQGATYTCIQRFTAH